VVPQGLRASGAEPPLGFDPEAGRIDRAQLVTVHDTLLPSGPPAPAIVLPYGRRRNRIVTRSRRETMHYNRISADCHIDLPWLPAALFTSNASAAMKDRMPFVVDSPDGPRWTTKKGASLGLVGGLGSTGSKPVPGQNYRVDVMISAGLFEDSRQGILRPASPERRRDAVDA